MLHSALKVFQREPVLYPFLFAIYPILFLWSNNITELSLYSSSADLFLPMAISVISTLLLVAVLRIVLRNWREAALLVTFILLLFFSYGHIQETLADSGWFGYPKHRILLPVWAGMFAVGAFLLVRYGSRLEGVTNPLNVITFVLVLFTLPNILTHKPLSASPLAEEGVTNAVSKVINPGEVDELPDIYYITAEGYSSARTLKKDLGYDNSPFINFLERKGFYVASESNSNHSRTVLSLASSLSMVTMDYLTPEDIEGPDGYYRILLDNKVVRLLREQGYRMVYLRERYSPKGKLPDGDLYFGCEKVGRVALNAEGFAGALLHTTALEPLMRKFSFLEAQKLFLRSCDFSQLIKSKHLEGPKFVVIHLLGPGKAFLVGNHSVEFYLEQVDFTNEGLSRVVNALLSDPDYSPVIVIQGDHGEGSFFGSEGSLATEPDRFPARMGILNAYHLPHGGNSLLYPNISPVNTFRVIFNRYLGGNFDLLDDRSYYSERGAFDFLDVTDIVRQSVGE